MENADILSSSVPLGALRPKKFYAQRPRQKSEKELTVLKDEIDRLNSAIDEKDRRKVALASKIKEFKSACGQICDLIKDIEMSTGQSFKSAQFSGENQSEFFVDEVNTLKAALGAVASAHSGLPQAFSDDFQQKAAQVFSEISQISSDFQSKRKFRAQTEEAIKKVDRVIEMCEKEKASIVVMTEDVQRQIEETDARVGAQCAQMSEKLKSASDELKKLQKISRQEVKIREPPKPERDQILESDFGITTDVNALTEQVLKEEAELLEAQQELQHTLSEIERGKAVLAQFKESVGKDEMKKNRRENQELRTLIEGQRSAAEKRMSELALKNRGLEKKLSGLQEDEASLGQFLSSLERKLSVQMQKLPSLSASRSKSEASESSSKKRSKVMSSRNMKSASVSATSNKM